VRNAVVPLGGHPDQDPRCVTATFDDGTTGRLEAADDGVDVAGGTLALWRGSKVRLEDVRHDDVHALVRVRSLPPDCRVGVVLREPPSGKPAEDTTTVWAVRLPNDRVRVEVTRVAGGRTVVHQGPILARARANKPFRLLVRVEGDRVWARVGDEDALGAGGYSGIATPGGGGHLGLRVGGSGRHVTIDYFLARAPDGPVGQISVDQAGRHTFCLFHPQLWSTFDPRKLFFEAGGLRLAPPDLGPAIGWIWPRAVGVAGDHVLISSDGSMWSPPPGLPLVVEYAGRREGEYFR
jgi:hypothetical protein